MPSTFEIQYAKKISNCPESNYYINHTLETYILQQMDNANVHKHEKPIKIIDFNI